MELEVTEDGLELPAEVQDAEKVVIRTPFDTLDLQSGFQMMISDGRFPLVTPEMFDGDEEDARNESLLPNLVSIKVYGEDAETYPVEFPN